MVDSRAYEDEGERDRVVAGRVHQYFEDISLGFGVPTLVQSIYHDHFWSGIHEVDAGGGPGSSRCCGEGFDNKGVHLSLQG